jgi:hypothetical protein
MAGSALPLIYDDRTELCTVDLPPCLLRRGSELLGIHDQ